LTLSGLQVKSPYSAGEHSAFIKSNISQDSITTLDVIGLAGKSPHPLGQLSAFINDKIPQDSIINSMH
jgi:hypothetical protein